MYRFSGHRLPSRGRTGRKLVIGFPLFGQGWKGVPDVNHGLYQNSAGPAPSPSGDALATNGVATYQTLSTLSGSGYVRYFDPQRIAVWLYSPETHTFWSYDDPFTIMLKMIYVNERTRQPGGAFVWALKDDDRDGDLVKAIGWLIKPDAIDVISRLVRAGN